MKKKVLCILSLALTACTNIIKTSHNYHKHPCALLNDIAQKQRLVNNTRININNLYKTCLITTIFAGLDIGILYAHNLKYIKLLKSQMSHNDLLFATLISVGSNAFSISMIGLAIYDLKKNKQCLVAFLSKQEKELQELGALMAELNNPTDPK